MKKALTLKEAEKKGYYTFRFSNGDYSYEKDRIQYLVRNGKIIAEGDWVWSYDDGDYEYYKDGVRYKFNKEGKLIKTIK